MDVYLLNNLQKRKNIISTDLYKIKIQPYRLGSRFCVNKTSKTSEGYSDSAQMQAAMKKNKADVR